MPAITGKTTLTGIIGFPVSHSLSPVMHNAAFAALGLEWAYLPFAVAPQRLGQAVAGLSALGVAGFNVTIPHKVAIVPLLDRISPEAELIGAVNTVALRDGVLTGFNTDGIGLLAALSGKLGFCARGRSVLVLGAGGAARSAVAALAGAGAARVDVANRSQEKGGALVRSLAQRLPGTGLCAHSLERLAEPSYLNSFDLIVNTTSVGMAGDSFPGLELSGLKRELAVYDMVYAPPVTPLLARARACGLAAANGIGMLVAQGEAAFAIWTGVAPPEGCMEQAVGAAGQAGIP
ncbi:MAG: shikimate dehydrogenase [Geobacteraceae bacterium GWC2_58_44]|nr:MAG: shikimate dehydrogenase [Geobacteraceae bacterium GWC2_58_44]